MENFGKLLETFGNFSLERSSNFKEVSYNNIVVQVKIE